MLPFICKIWGSNPPPPRTYAPRNLVDWPLGYVCLHFFTSIPPSAPRAVPPSSVSVLDYIQRNLADGRAWICAFRVRARRLSFLVGLGHTYCARGTFRQPISTSHLCFRTTTPLSPVTLYIYSSSSDSYPVQAAAYSLAPTSGFISFLGARNRSAQTLCLSLLSHPRPW